MNWLETILLETEEAEAPRSFFFWSALAAISAVVKNKVYLDRYFYKLYPNVYIFLVAKSGLRKGIPIAMAKALVKELDAERELAELDAVIGSLLGTRKTRLGAPAAIARAQGEPYDPHRLERCQELHAALRDWPPVLRPNASSSDAEFANISFVDTYFSNFIEGTKFEIDEAVEIVFHGRIPDARPADAHDIIGTFRVVGSREEMSRSAADLPEDFEGFRLLALRCRRKGC